MAPEAHRGHLCLLLLLTSLLALPLSAQFREVSTTAGLDAGAVDPNLIAGGLVSFDYDGDRVPDLYISGGRAAGKLYRNNWDGTFTDRTSAAGLSGLVGATGLVSGDLDGDGDRELFAATLAGEPLKLYENIGDGRFRQVTDGRLPELVAYSSSATLGDYDLDGDLDIYVANYLDGAGPRQGGQVNYLLRNEGGLRFTEVAAELGIDEHGCGLGALFTDDDGDGDPDLWVANDYGYFVTPNELYRNSGDETFAPYGNYTRTAVGINAMGIASGDYDGDGDLDYYLTNIRANPFFENGGRGRTYTQPQSVRNTELAELTGWGTAFLDYDLDGILDLAVANGHIVEGENQLKQADVLFRGRGERSFLRQSGAEGLGGLGRGRGLLTIDYDLDGDQDIAVNVVRPTTEGEERALLYKNNTDHGGNWLKVELTGSTADPHGTTARVTAFVAGRPYVREVSGGGSYQSHAAGPLHFGLGRTSRIDSLVVNWMGGQRQVFYELPTDQYLLIRQGVRQIVRVVHQTETGCGREGIQLESSDTQLAYTKFIREPAIVVAEQSIYLSAGSAYAGVAIYQDTVVYDTVRATGEHACPQLRRVNITVSEDFIEGIYPNPLAGRASVRFLSGSSGETSLRLLDVRGREVAQWEITSREGEVYDRPLTLPDGLATGTYFLHIGARTQVQAVQIIR